MSLDNDWQFKMYALPLSLFVHKKSSVRALKWTPALAPIWIFVAIMYIRKTVLGLLHTGFRVCGIICFIAVKL